MLSIILLIAFAIAQSRLASDKPWLWALVYGLINGVISMLISGGVVPFAALIVSFFILTAYAYVYFRLLARFADTVFLWLAILIGGAVLPFFLLAWAS